MDYVLFTEEYKKFTLHDPIPQAYETVFQLHFSNLGYYFSVKDDKVMNHRYHTQLAAIVAQMYEPKQVKEVSDLVRQLFRW